MAKRKKNGSKKKKIQTLAQEAVALKAKPAGSGQNLFETLWTRKKIRPLGQNRKTKGNAWAWPVQEPYKIPAQATGTDA